MATTRTQQKYKVTLYWLGGNVQEGIGWGNSDREAAADAMNSMGHGGGAVRALDYFKAELWANEGGGRGL